MKALGELVIPKSGVRSIGDIVKSGQVGRPLADVLMPRKRKIEKRRTMARLRKYAAPENTMEALIAQVREPAIAAVPCEAPPAASGSPYRDGQHWLSVVGTEADRAIVHCDNENKTWAVPYTTNANNEIETGEPTEVGMTFVPVNEDEDETGDDEAEGGEEADPEGEE